VLGQHPIVKDHETGLIGALFHDVEASINFIKFNDGTGVALPLLRIVGQIKGAATQNESLPRLVDARVRQQFFALESGYLLRQGSDGL